jgi:sugar/nucleoside kinase (ribokinase family)
MSGIEDRGFVVAGVGAGSLDYFLPNPGERLPGSDEPWEIWPGHIPGDKGLLTLDQITFLEIAEKLEAHIGGNAVNSLAWMAMQESVSKANLLTTVGYGDAASEAIMRHLPRVNISDKHVLRVPDYLPSIAAIEHESKGSDRMVRSRKRGAMSGHMDDAYLGRGMQGADVVLTASLKDTELMERSFELAPADAFLTFNPSVGEIKDPDSRAEMLRIMLSHNLGLLALNEVELPALMSINEKLTVDQVRKLAEHTSKRYSQYVLCTLGKDGLLLAANGDSVIQPSNQVPKEEIGTTLGAGDRAHAVAALRIAEGIKNGNLDVGAVLEEAAYSTAGLVRVKGSHQDMYGEAA